MALSGTNFQFRRTADYNGRMKYAYRNYLKNFEVLKTKHIFAVTIISFLELKRRESFQQKVFN